MSKSRIPLLDAQAIAQRICSELQPFCERVAIAGSIRRRKPLVGDIEIVAAPKTYLPKNLFGEPLPPLSRLDDFDFSPLGRVVKGGSRYKQLELAEGMSLDLFIVIPPAQWGVIYMIRTGSAEFSHRMVTPRRMGGKLPSQYHISEGALWQGRELLPTPEEADYFRLCGMEPPDPEERSI